MKPDGFMNQCLHLPKWSIGSCRWVAVLWQKVALYFTEESSSECACVEGIGKRLNDAAVKH